MWQQAACHRLAGQWHHEIISFTKSFWNPMTRKRLQERTLCSPNDKQPLIIVLWAQIYFKSSADFFFSSSRVVVFSLRSEGGLTKRAAGMCSSRSSQAWLFAWGLFSFGRAGLMNWRKSEQKSSQSQADNLEQGGGGSFFLVFVGHQPCTPRMFLLRRWLPRSERRLRCHLCDSSVWLATQRGRDRQCLWYSLIALM